MSDILDLALPFIIPKGDKGDTGAQGEVPAAALATKETSTTASKAYSAGDYLYYNSKLYKVTADIASGGTITPDTNCVEAKLADDVSDVKSHLDDLTPEVLAMYPQKQITDTAIASFADGADGVPVKSLTVGIEPVQDLHGYDNPWPAGGNKNLVYKIISGANINASGVIGTDEEFSLACAEVVSGETYTFSEYPSLLNPNVVAYFDSDPAIGSTSYNESRETGVTSTFTATYTGYICLRFTPTSTNKMQLEKGSTASAYVPYANICPISGHTSAVVTRTGKNLFSGEYSNYYVTTNAQDVSYLVSDANAATAILPIKGGQKYTITRSGGNRFMICESVETPQAGSDHPVTLLGNDTSVNTKTVTTSANAKYLLVYVTNNTSTSPITSLQVELGETATAYEAPNIQTITIDLDGTRYGGTLDVTNGKLTVTHGSFDCDDVTWTENHATVQGKTVYYFSHLFSDIKPVAANGDTPTWITAEQYVPVRSTAIAGNPGHITVNTGKAVSISTGFPEDNTVKPDGRVIYELATPVVIDLTPASLTTISGQNNVFASTGDIEELTYRADLSTILPANPSSDGTYILKVTVASGVATYAWVEEE